MEKYEITLTPRDINTIFEALCESNDVEVADSVLTDVFMVLTKLNKNVVLKPENDDIECELSGISNTITNIINDIGDALDDIDDKPLSEEDEFPEYFDEDEDPENPEYFEEDDDDCWTVESNDCWSVE